QVWKSGRLLPIPQLLQSVVVEVLTHRVLLTARAGRLRERTQIFIAWHGTGSAPDDAFGLRPPRRVHKLRGWASRSGCRSPMPLVVSPGSWGDGSLVTCLLPPGRGRSKHGWLGSSLPR